MLRSTRSQLIAAFVTGLLFVGIPFWAIPYSQVNLPDAFFGIGLVVVFALSFLLRLSGAARFMTAVNVMALTLPAALMLRVLVEALADPTRHNLWPLALVIAALMGYLTALPGAGAAQLLRWLGRGRDRDVG